MKSPALGKEGSLIFVDLSNGKSRIGGTALAQVFKTLGNQTPDLEDPIIFRNAFNVIQSLIKGIHFISHRYICCLEYLNIFLFLENKILSGHDISDGGLITCVLEMCFAGISGIQVNVTHKSGWSIEILFAEEVGWVLEVDMKESIYVLELFRSHKVPAFVIGRSTGFGLKSEARYKFNIFHPLNKQNVLTS